MTGLSLSRRAWSGLVLCLLLGLIVFLPLRIAVGLSGLDRLGVSARGIGGSVWSGRIVQLMLGQMPLGTVDAGVAPLPLLIGRVRLDIVRKAGAPDDIAGALTYGLGGRFGIDDVTGTASPGTAFAPLPIGGIEMVDVTAHFAGGACSVAQGRVKARIAGDMPGVNLSQGLTGDIRCDGAALLLPLVSQSGLETLNLRIRADGRYSADMRIRSSDPSLAQGLQAAGFVQAGDSFVRKVDGAL